MLKIIKYFNVIAVSLFLLSCASTPEATSNGAQKDKCKKTKCKKSVCKRATSVKESDPDVSLNDKTIRSGGGRPDTIDNLGVNDPIEGFNRSMFGVENFMMDWLIRPLGTGWTTIMPRPGVRAFNNMFYNIEFPARMVSCMCQNRWGDSGMVFNRFLVNITLGVAGFWDPATIWFNMPKYDEDMGQAFATWGIGRGCTVYLPGPGPINARDTGGAVCDMALDPKMWAPFTYGLGAFVMMNRSVDRYNDYDQLRSASYDSYALYRNFKAMQRQLQVSDWKEVDLAVPQGKPEYKALTPDRLNSQIDYKTLKDYKSQCPEIDTLRFEMFDIQSNKKSFWCDLSPWNNDFYNQGSRRSIALFKDRPKMEYMVWQQDNKHAPLAVIIPGIGSHFTATTAVALAELLYEKKWSVAIISNTFNPAFIESALTAPVPGYTPQDTKDVQRAIAAVINDLEKKNKAAFQRVTVMGYSLGGLLALHLAALEEKDGKIWADRYLAINPPVDLFYSAEQLDKMGETPLKWKKEIAFDRGIGAVGCYLIMMNRFYAREPEKQTRKVPERFITDIQRKRKEIRSRKDALTDSHNINIRRDAATFLIGLAFKSTLSDAMVTIQRERGMKVITKELSWGDRTKFYRESGKYTFKRFINEYIIKYYAQQYPGFSLKKAAAETGISYVAASLKNNPKVRVIHSLDDFLENDKQRKYINELFKKRITFFDHGGHLGNLYTTQFHAEMFRYLNVSESLSPENIQKFPEKVQVDEKLEIKVNDKAVRYPFNIPEIPEYKFTD